MNDNYRIYELYPNVEKITIKYEQEYLSAFGKFREESSHEYQKNFVAEFNIKCINRDCTNKWFDLYPEVSYMIAHNEKFSSGSLKCVGNEANDHNNKCPCVLNYTIQIEYHTDSPR